MRPIADVRFEQVAELTRGTRLPLPPLPDWTMHLLTEWISSSWNALLSDHPVTMRRGSEVEVTTLLESRLREMLFADPLLGLLASSVDRGIETMNFDGKRLEVRPDLSFLLTKRDPRFRLIVECKILDRTKKKTVELYFSKGIVRFIAGDYAWGCREAIMLAYVRADEIMDATLFGFLALPEHDRHRHSEPRRLAPPRPLTRGSLGLSAHAREFAYVHQPADPTPGPIALWHLWLTI